MVYYHHDTQCTRTKSRTLLAHRRHAFCPLFLPVDGHLHNLAAEASQVHFDWSHDDNARNIPCSLHLLRAEPRICSVCLYLPAQRAFLSPLYSRLDFYLHGGAAVLE